MVDKQDYITDFDLSSYEIQNNLGKKIIVLKGNRGGYFKNSILSTEDNTKSVGSLVNKYNENRGSYYANEDDIQIYTEYDEKVFEKIVDFEIYIDRGSIELFADGGKVAITNLLFVETALNALSSEGEILNLEVINLG